VRVSQVTVRVLSEITNKALVTQVTVRVLSENVQESGSRRQFYLCG
jgi:hypothetical protein